MFLQGHCKMSYCGGKCLYFSPLVWSRKYRSVCSSGKYPCPAHGGLQLICKVPPSPNDYIIDFMFQIEKLSIFLTVSSAQPDWDLTWNVLFLFPSVLAVKMARPAESLFSSSDALNNSFYIVLPVPAWNSTMPTLQTSMCIALWSTDMKTSYIFM